MFNEMDKDHSTVSDFQTSTESVFSYELQRTNPWSITSTEQVLESDTETIDGVYILYGMGGILVFFIIYTLCYSYFLHLKENDDRKRAERQRLNERRARQAAAVDIVYGERDALRSRVTVENINERNPNTKVKGAYGFNRTLENTQRVEGNSVFEPRSSSQVFQNESHSPEDSQDQNCQIVQMSKLLAQYGSSCSVLQSDENDIEVKDNGWMSTPPLCFSTPQESNENLFVKENSTNIIGKSDVQMEKCDGGKPLEKDCNVTPSKNDGRKSPAPERRSRSSPTTPDIVRRRFPSSERIPRRPSSWQGS